MEKEPEKKRFYFYKDWAKKLMIMPESIRTAILDAYCKYIATGELPDENNHLRYGYLHEMVEDTKRDYKCWLDKIYNRNKDNGCKGGRPRKETQNNPMGLNETQNNPMGLNGFSPDIDIDIDKDKGYISKEIDKDSDVCTNACTNTSHIKNYYDLLYGIGIDEELTETETRKIITRFDECITKNPDGTYADKKGNPITDIGAYFRKWMQPNKAQMQGEFYDITPFARNERFIEAASYSLGVDKGRFQKVFETIARKWKKEKTSHVSEVSARFHAVAYAAKTLGIEVPDEVKKYIQKENEAHGV